MPMTTTTTTKAAFSRLCGVSKQAIDKAVNAGSVILSGKKVDLTHRITVEYLSNKNPEYKNHLAENTIPPPKKPPVKKTAEPTPPIITAPKVSADAEPFMLTSDITKIDTKDLIHYEKKDLEKLKIYEQTRKENLVVREKEGELVKRGLVKRVYAQQYSVLKEQLGTLEDKVTKPICALFGETEDSEQSIKVRELINKETGKALNHFKRVMNDYLVAVGSEKI